jgi:hypothetical protein
MALPAIPFRLEPRVPISPGMEYACLEQSQQRHDDQSDLKGTQDGVLGPGSVILQAEALLVVTEAILAA